MAACCLELDFNECDINEKRYFIFEQSNILLQFNIPHKCSPTFRNALGHGESANNAEHLSVLLSLPYVKWINRVFAECDNIVEIWTMVHVVNKSG